MIATFWCPASSSARSRSANGESGTVTRLTVEVDGTVAALGILQRVGAMHLPGKLEVLGQTPILVLSCSLFLVEFLADKIPIVDTVWDAVHTFIRIPAAAALGFAALGELREPWRMGAALLRAA